MTQDEIISMAREAGIGALTEYGKEALERFAGLVAAHWQKIHEQEMSMMSELCADRILEEREVCAKVCDKEMDDWDYQSVVNVALNNCAAAIRARGK